ncbi:MAG TPA: DUF692 domain-containing protein [Gammaproteobacteria bacterium]|jgi:uncharacterized protein (UPF0276 family)|nr:DUF692 domain-containing protein [Gammaproteobacteria bacterium]
MNRTISRPNLGFGLGLRTEHYQDILANRPDVDWFEIITENYLIPGGKPHYYLDSIREHYPMVMHGVSMSIGSSDPLDMTYMQQVKNLAAKIKPEWISDHLCFTGIHGKNTHDLLPLPYTDECVMHLANKIQQAQDFLGQRILIENVSSYITYHQSQMTEWEFLKNISESADCLILLDINNIYVSSINHRFDPIEYINAVPRERVWQIHLAGHSDMGNYIIDTHDDDIIDPVWELYSTALQRFGFVSTMIERDDNIPSLQKLISELQLARNIAATVLTESAA